jgi:hypothetical protein
MSYPTSPAFNAINLESDSPSLFSEAISGRMQSRKIGGQKWRFTASYATMTRNEFQPVWAFVVAQKGRHGVFTVVPTGISDTNGTATGVAAVNEASGSAIGDTTITIDGITGSLKAGDMIKFAGHDKVYMLTADRSGAGDITIEPALVSAVTNNEQIIYNNVPFTMRLANDVQQYKVGTGMFYNFEVDLVEALS